MHIGYLLKTRKKDVDSVPIYYAAVRAAQL